MLNLVDIVESLSDWLDENVCSQITLLEPDDEIMDEGYTKKRVCPKAYPLFSPYGYDSPEYAIPGVPGIIVCVLEGSDEVKSRRRTIQIQLQLISWAPGAYKSDLLQPVKDPSKPLGIRYQCSDPYSDQAYTRNREGWKDNYNFLDLTVRALEKVEFIHGMRVKLKDGALNFGHFRTETGPLDFYPYWISYIDLELETGIVHLSKQYEDKL